MRFSLYYRGDLPTSGNSKSRSARKRIQAAKIEIRDAIAPQLEDLWRQVPLMPPKKKDNEGNDEEGNDQNSPFLNPDYELTAVREVEGQQFACLINSKVYLVAELDILFLRPEEPGSLVTQGGDVDNRIKTLLDALSVPQKDQVLRGSKGNGKLTHCLLDSDNLITRLNISVDRLLDANNKDEVLLVITVNVSCASVTLENLALGV